MTKSEYQIAINNTLLYPYVLDHLESCEKKNGYFDVTLILSQLMQIFKSYLNISLFT